MAGAEESAVIKKRPTSQSSNLLRRVPSGQFPQDSPETVIQRWLRLYLLLQAKLGSGMSHPGGTGFEGL